MDNTALLLERSAAGTVNAADPVLFDDIQYTAGDIQYDPLSGVITFERVGRYSLHWWIATQSAAPSSNAIFALSCSQGEFIQGNSPSRTGQVGGMAVLEIAAVPATLALLNATTSSFYYCSSVPVKASLLITQQPDAASTPVSMSCFAVAQLANILEQMIIAYPTTTWIVFSNALPSFSGVPLDLYSAPDGQGPGLLRLLDSSNGYEALSLSQITAVYPGDGTVYDPSFTFLPPPDPLPPGCDTDTIAAFHSYLPVGTPDVNVRLGPNISASGGIYKNEYGLLILSDAMGNTPIVIPTPQILRVYTTTDPVSSVRSARSKTYQRPSITIDGENKI